MKTTVSPIVDITHIILYSHHCLDAGVPGRVPDPPAHCLPLRVRPRSRPLHSGGAPGGQPPWTGWNQG